MASIINAATSGGLISTADTSGILQLQTASTTAVTITAAQNVGIGTSSPAYKLDSRVTTSASIVSAINLDASGNSNGDGSAVNFSRAGNALSGVARISAVKAEVSNNETDLVFSNYAAGSLTEKMRIVGATGNLGIGTNSPTTKLDVTNGYTTDNNVSLTLTNSQGAATDNGAIAYRTSTGAGFMTSAQINSGPGSGYAASYLKFRVADSSQTLQERMRIDVSGNLGLGVTPSAWGNTYKAFQAGTTGVIAGIASQTDNFVFHSYANAFNDNTNWKYIASQEAGRYELARNVHKWFNAPSGTAGNAITFTQAMTLDASGNFQLGTTTAFNPNGFGRHANIRGATNAVLYVGKSDVDTNCLEIGWAATESYIGNVTNTPLTFLTNNTERARIDSSGNLLVGKTASDVTVAGTQIESTGTVGIVRNGAVCLIVNRLTDDGTLVSLRQASTEEGTISVSGTTVSYNGGHLSRWAQMLTTPELFKGTVMSNLDEMNVYTKDGQPVANEQLNKVKVSDVEGDVNVAGVFVNWSHDEDHNVDEINMAMTGDMIIRIAQGVTVVRGDLLMSAGDGTAKPQGDDIIRSKTVAKVTSNHITCTYADGSYCVPCVLMAC
jgi:hypothetical protein